MKLLVSLLVLSLALRSVCECGRGCGGVSSTRYTQPRQPSIAFPPAPLPDAQEGATDGAQGIFSNTTVVTAVVISSIVAALIVACERWSVWRSGVQRASLDAAPTLAQMWCIARPSLMTWMFSGRVTTTARECSSAMAVWPVRAAGIDRLSCTTPRLPCRNAKKKAKRQGRDDKDDMDAVQDQHAQYYAAGGEAAAQESKGADSHHRVDVRQAAPAPAPAASSGMDYYRSQQGGNNGVRSRQGGGPSAAATTVTSPQPARRISHSRAASGGGSGGGQATLVIDDED